MRTPLRRIGAALAGVALLSGCSLSPYELPLPGGADVGEDPFEVTVQFRDVMDLVPQSAVKVDDLTVGKVRGISLDGWTAKVTLELDRTLELPDDTVATIRQTTLLGEKFVSLAAPSGGGAGRLGEGDVIPLDRTGRNPEVEEVLSALSVILNGGGIENLSTITSELNDALEGNSDEVKRLLRDASSVIGQLDDNRQDILTAIERVDRLARAANRQTDAITAALDDLPPALETLDAQRDDLVRLLDALDRLSGVGTRVIDASKENTIEDLRLLQPVLARLTESGESLVNSLSVLPTFPFPDAIIGETPAEARRTEIGDFENLSVKLDLDLGTLLQTAGLSDAQDTDKVLEELRDRLAGQAPGAPASPQDPGSSSTPSPSAQPSDTPDAPALPRLPATPTVPSNPLLPPLLPRRPQQDGGSGGVVPQLCGALGLCRVSPQTEATAASIDDQLRARGLDPALASSFIVPVVAP